jgi:hypothetical protein
MIDSSPPSKRNRPEGWKHAKVDGHLNEHRLSVRLCTDLTLANYLSLQCFSKELGIPESVSGGGASASHVSDVFGGRTNGKPDLEVSWGSGNTVRISVKKSRSGQVFLTSVDRFTDGFRIHYGQRVPAEVERCLSLFIGGDEEAVRMAMRGRRLLGPVHRRTGVLLEEHQIRLVAKTLETYFRDDWHATIAWFGANIASIADFAFSRGYAKASADFATHLWYVKAAGYSKDSLLSPMQNLTSACSRHSDMVSTGRKNGGTTIQLPFGFLQMHSPKAENLMQFHHSRAKISAILK